MEYPPPKPLQPGDRVTINGDTRVWVVTSQPYLSYGWRVALRLEGGRETCDPLTTNVAQLAGPER